MALPRSVESVRTLELKAKLDAATTSLQKWPMPTMQDYTLIGAIVVLYSYAEFNLRRIAEALDYSNLLPKPWKGKAPRLDFAQIENAVRAAPVWSVAEIQWLQNLADLRATRNLVAHFVVRRFPEDDAFLFVAKSAKDLKRVFGADVDTREALTSICDCSQIIQVQRRVEEIQNWLSKVAPDFENKYGPPLIM